MATFASAVPGIRSQVSKLKIGHHVTLAMPLLGTFCQPKARTWYSLPVCTIQQLYF